jgi:hypothetical protein
MTEALYLNPMGWTMEKPKVALSPIDRSAVLRNAHVIARRYRAAYADAPRGSKGGVGGFPINPVACRAGHAFTAAEIAASCVATRRRGPRTSVCEEKYPMTLPAAPTSQVLSTRIC